MTINELVSDERIANLIEVLSFYSPEEKHLSNNESDLASALRELQQYRAASEPVAWLVYGSKAFKDRVFTTLSAAEQAVKDRKDGSKIKALYAAPQLTSAEREELEQYRAAEPVLYCMEGDTLDEENVSTSKAVVDAWVEEWNGEGRCPGEPQYRTVPLYRHAAPQVTSVPTFEFFWSEFKHPFAEDDELKSFASEIWNACRATTAAPAVQAEQLSSNTEPVSQPYTLPECFERLFKHAQGLTFGDDWNRGTAAKYHRDLLIKAVDDCRAAIASGNSPVIPDGWIPVSERMPEQGRYISAVSRHGEYASGLVEDDWLDLHDGTSFGLGEVYLWLPLPELPAAPKQEDE